MSDRDRDRRSTALPAPKAWEGEIELHVRAYRAGESRADHGAWLVHRLAPAISAVFHNQGTPRAQARDLTQEALLRVFQKIEDYRFEAPFSAWVRQITVNLLRNDRRDDRNRRRRLQEEPLEILVEPAEGAPLALPHPALRQEPEAEADAGRSQLRRALAAALDELPPGMRRCLAGGRNTAPTNNSGEIEMNPMRWITAGLCFLASLTLTNPAGAADLGWRGFELRGGVTFPADWDNGYTSRARPTWARSLAACAYTRVSATPRPTPPTR
jgi:RNA polymerase sigma factor (sigma-70 family)